ncbi:hypothetical protein E2C01_093037 [Portunus trituberculatus]|uniref:Uncharacterized protein n=1 Tax=Portunus trituberculatus TaxID=210409 RepID=A0A5B7JLT3_PORTR|nr:hypothetical protein [Portunus trituberculatus]
MVLVDSRSIHIRLPVYSSLSHSRPSCPSVFPFLVH